MALLHVHAATTLEPGAAGISNSKAVDRPGIIDSVDGGCGCMPDCVGACPHMYMMKCRRSC